MRCLLLIVFLLAGVAARPDRAAAEETFHEQWLKASFLFKLPQFVSWPADRACIAPGASEPARVCVFGEDPFRHILKRMAETFDPQQRSVRVFHDYELQDLRCCDVLFVSSSERHRVAPLLDATRSLPLITVSDVSGFSESGGTVQITSAGPSMEFSVNYASARGRGVTISPKLLRLASAVHE